VAIERVRLFKSEHDQRKLAETMRDIGTTLTASLDLNEILDLLLDQLSRLVPYDGGNVMLIDGKRAYVARYRGYEHSGKKRAATLLNRTFEIDHTENLRTIFNSRKPLIIADTAKFENWIPSEITVDYHSWLGVPVIIEGKIEAIFSLDKVEPGFYTQEHARLVSLFATQSSLAIKNSRLFATESKRIKELDSLRATLTDISSQLDSNVLLKEIVKRAIYLLNAEIGEIGLYETSENALRILVSENTVTDNTGTLIQIGEGIIGKVAETRQPQTISDYQYSKSKEKGLEEKVPYSELAVPMLAGENELLGVISIGDYNVNRVFDENDIRLLNLFAQQATIALRNARLFADAKRRAEEAETLRKAGAVVVSSLNQDEAIRLILEQLGHVVPYDSASVLLHTKGVLKIVGGHGFKDANPVLGLEVPLDRSNPGATVFLDNKPYLIGNISQEAPNFNQITNNKYVIRSWLGVPLTIHNRPIGILSLDAHNPGQFTEEHARLVIAFADQVAIALENSRLYESAVQAATRNETIYKLSQTISANIRSDEIYTAIHHATAELMETEFFCISLLNEKKGTIDDVYIADREEPIELSSRPISQGLFGKVLAEGKSVLYNTFDESMIAATGAILTGNLDQDEISQSILIVPLKIGSKMIGVLSAQSYQPYAYTESDLEMLELLGANAAIALENARLFSEVQELAITDPGTGLYNRRKFLELADQEFNRSTRYARSLSAIMIDIDHFKIVNDTFGHSIGDQVLIQLAQVCSTGVRQVDILARYGGEEFMVLLPETNAQEAAVIAERLRFSTEATSFTTTAGPLHITISLGVAELDKSCESLNELVDRADFAQYASKDAGRNRVTCWSPDIKQRAKDTGVLRLRKHTNPS
jgi:diguanylate cyclase (GGDEF)-like protein